MKDFTFKNEWFDLLLMANAAGIKEPWNGNLQFLIIAIRDYVRYDVLPTEEEKEHWDHATYYAFDRIMEELMEEKEAQEEKERRDHENKVRAGSSRSKQNRAEHSRTEQKEAEPSREEKEAEKTEKEKKQKKENTEKEVYASSVDNTCNNNSSVLSPSDACAEPKIDSAPEAPPLALIILNDGTEFAVTQDIYDRLARTYPAVDTMQQLREIENWCFSNPKNRKTRNGVMRFINSWFSREQDKGLVPKYRQRNQSQPRLTAEEIYNLPAISPWETGG